MFQGCLFIRSIIRMFCFIIDVALTCAFTEIFFLEGAHVWFGQKKFYDHIAPASWSNYSIVIDQVWLEVEWSDPTTFHMSAQRAKTRWRVTIRVWFVLKSDVFLLDWAFERASQVDNKQRQRLSARVFITAVCQVILGAKTDNRITAYLRCSFRLFL